MGICIANPLLFCRKIILCGKMRCIKALRTYYNFKKNISVNTIDINAYLLYNDYVISAKHNILCFPKYLKER